MGGSGARAGTLGFWRLLRGGGVVGWLLLGSRGGGRGVGGALAEGEGGEASEAGERLWPVGVLEVAPPRGLYRVRGNRLRVQPAPAVERGIPLRAPVDVHGFDRSMWFTSAVGMHLAFENSECDLPFVHIYLPYHIDFFYAI